MIQYILLLAETVTFIDLRDTKSLFAAYDRGGNLFERSYFGHTLCDLSPSLGQFLLQLLPLLLIPL